MDAEEKEADLDMDIIEPPFARPQEVPREKGMMLKCVHDLYVRASKNLSVKESAKVKELLVEHNETNFHDPEKPLTRTNTTEHEIPTTSRPVRILPRSSIALYVFVWIIVNSVIQPTKMHTCYQESMIY